MKTEFNEKYIERLGKFKVNNINHRELLNLVGYYIPIAIRDGQGIVIDENNLVGIFVVYDELKGPRLEFMYDEEEDPIDNNYTDYVNLSRAHKTIINSYSDYITKNDIENFILTELCKVIDYSKIIIDRICKKWVQKNKMLKDLKGVEDNIDQTYILRTNFYGGR